jgi:5-methylcytosine-specific restriction endonuclease McrA
MLEKPAKRGPKPRKRIQSRTPIQRSSAPIRTRRPLGTVRREAKAAGDLTPEQWEAIVRFYVGRCGYCETARATQQDHMDPITGGGKHTASNVVPACERCNYRKGTARGWAPKRRHPFMVAA